MVRMQGWGTIHYKSTADVLQDVRKVWTGYRSSYDPSDPVVCVPTPLSCCLRIHPLPEACRIHHCLVLRSP